MTVDHSYELLALGMGRGGILTTENIKGALDGKYVKN
jgi:hypothetical protein